MQRKIDEIVNQILVASERDYISLCEVLSKVKRVIAPEGEQKKREITIEVCKKLLGAGLVVFQFRKNEDGSFSIDDWAEQDSETVGTRIALEWQKLLSDPNPGDICWFR